MKYLALLGLFFFLCISVQSQSADKTVTLEAGDTAPGFELKDIDGKMVSLSNYPNAKGFIVIFTANTCPYAIAYEDRIIALNKKSTPKGYPVIAVNANPPAISSGDSYDKMQSKAKNKGFNFPYLFDEGQKVTNQYGARVTPHVFLLKKEGKGYKVMYTGAIDNDTQNVNSNKTLYVENAITALEAGKAVDVPFTKAIGCTVKRS